MAYCTKADILEQLSESELIQLTDDDNLGIVDEDIVTRAIADADAEIDSYCGSKYTVPFSSAPTIIRVKSVDMAIYNLYARRRGAPDSRQRRYDDAIHWLENVAAALVSIPTDEAATSTDDGPESIIPASDRVFTRGRSSDGSSGSLDNY